MKCIVLDEAKPSRANVTCAQHHLTDYFAVGIYIGSLIAAFIFYYFNFYIIVVLYVCNLALDLYFVNN